ncbi:heparan-alpha-glucosaminide N-acetyltransferase-like [Homarus americanus]|uniref:heparan-alpha-glucosaminide N-acetyltransferase-like n=1 Tax=Homarus americanus TaxID=6706 RepID=UPI001C43C2A2|nr:heparan-alpha-glucosaminide N-acetyltransferase-like [Homarus americanus]
MVLGTSRALSNVTLCKKTNYGTCECSSSHLLLLERLAQESASIVELTLGKGLAYVLDSFIMSLVDSSTTTCGTGDHLKHLTLGEACLEVSNSDPVNNLQLWAQAVECYKCPPWPYLTLAPTTSQALVVNTTYPTELFIRNKDGSDLHTFFYHFGEYGTYQLGINTNNVTQVKILHKAQNEFLPLITAAIFFFMLVFVWQCAKFLVRRMNVPCSPRAVRSHVVDEHSPLLVAASGSESSPSTSQSLPPSVESSSQVTVPDSMRQGGRLQSLDTFRGIAIVVMIFVNYGGAKYYFFSHARWNGLTVADLVFPWFMWIMGVSLIFSVRSQLKRTTKRYRMVLKILKRCIILFALGLFINSENGHNYIPTFRIMGVLQRFSICYFITALMEVYFMNPQESPEYVWYWKIRDIVRSGVQWVITVVLVVIHSVITFSLSVPGCPTGYLGPGGLHDGGQYGNCTGGAAGYVDKMILGEAHMYSHPTCRIIYNSDEPYDPEGFLGILTTVLTVQLGAAAGRIIITYQDHGSRVKRWMAWGASCGMLAGFICGWRKEGGPIPVNKNLWSLSFVLTTACFAFLLLSFLYLVIDKWKWWSGNPFRYPGMNAILLYVGHEVCNGLFPWFWEPVKQYHAYFLLMNLWGTSIWVIVAYLCHRRKLYISV